MTALAQVRLQKLEALVLATRTQGVTPSDLRIAIADVITPLEIAREAIGTETEC